MPEAAIETAAAPNGARDPNSKVVQMRRTMQQKAEALNGWAQGQARALATTAKEKPLATAGVSAGTAFAAGLVLGLLLTRSAPPPKPTWKDRLMELKPNWR